MFGSWRRTKETSGWFKSGVNKYYVNTEKKKQAGLDESRADIWTLTAIWGERKKVGYMSNIILGLGRGPVPKPGVPGRYW